MTTSALFAALGFVAVVAVVIVWFALAYLRQQKLIWLHNLETELEPRGEIVRLDLRESSRERQA